MTMHDTIINIGLRIDDPAGPIEIMPSAVTKAMRALNIVFAFPEVHMSDSEPTLVTKVQGGIDHLLHALADAFDQDCIAVWDMYHAEGRLIGPRAAKWGDFDPTRFILPSGRRLREAA